jgi:hypothetical protein
MRKGLFLISWGMKKMYSSVPYSSRNRKSDSSFSPFLIEENLLYLQGALQAVHSPQSVSFPFNVGRQTSCLSYLLHFIFSVSKNWSERKKNILFKIHFLMVLPK